MLGNVRLASGVAAALALAVCSLGPVPSTTRAADVTTISFMGWDNAPR